MRKKEKKQEELRKVPIKNYVILTIAFLVTFLIILYLLQESFFDIHHILDTNYINKG